jgi:hypothetical protein
MFAPLVVGDVPYTSRESARTEPRELGALRSLGRRDMFDPQGDDVGSMVAATTPGQCRLSAFRRDARAGRPMRRHHYVYGRTRYLTAPGVLDQIAELKPPPPLTGSSGWLRWCRERRGSCTTRRSAAYIISG